MMFTPLLPTYAAVCAAPLLVSHSSNNSVVASLVNLCNDFISNHTEQQNIEYMKTIIYALPAWVAAQDKTLCYNEVQQHAFPEHLCRKELLALLAQVLPMKQEVYGKLPTPEQTEISDLIAACRADIKCDQESIIEKYDVKLKQKRMEIEDLEKQQDQHLQESADRGAQLLSELRKKKDQLDKAVSYAEVIDSTTLPQHVKTMLERHLMAKRRRL
jgi:hypothetical protein